MRSVAPRRCGAPCWPISATRPTLETPTRRSGVVSLVKEQVHHLPTNGRFWPDSEAPTGGPAGPLTEVDLPCRRSEWHGSF
jgi:hypothetical protein